VSARVVLWVVDDVADNHALVRRSLPPGFEAVCELVSFLDADEAILHLEVGLDADPERLPDVIFMDFFLGDAYGNELTKRIRVAFAQKGLAGPFIVGHSSSRPASLEIVRSGGDVAIEKDRNAPVSPGVRDLFPDVAALESHAGRARRPLPRSDA
jgi:CheY-like chemotaxis protein